MTKKQGGDTSTKNGPATATAMAEKSDANALRSFPFYEEGKVPQYQKYHARVSYLDELELIWGKRWGAQGIGRLREVAMVRPTRNRSQEAVRRGLRFLRLQWNHAGLAVDAGAAPQSGPHLRKTRY